MADVNAPMMVIRKKLSVDEGAPTSTRYNPETDTIETSVDGGVTWTPNPNADPRTNPAYQQPPLTGDNRRCASAHGMSEGIREYVEGIQDASNALTIANLGIDFVILAIPGIGWMWALALAVAEAIQVIGAGAVNSAFTGDVYHQLQCIFFCNSDVNGQIDELGMENALTDVDEQIDDVIVTQVVTLFFSQWGMVGLNNNGVRLQDEDADCTDCFDCVDCENDCFGGGEGEEFSPGVGMSVDNTFGNPAPAAKSVVLVSGSNVGHNLNATITLPCPGRIAHVSFELYWTTSGVGNPSFILAQYIQTLSDTLSPIETSSLGAPTTPRGEWVTVEWDFTVDADVYYIQCGHAVTAEGGTSEGWIDNICYEYYVVP